MWYVNPRFVFVVCIKRSKIVPTVLVFSCHQTYTTHGYAERSFAMQKQNICNFYYLKMYHNFLLPKYFRAFSAIYWSIWTFNLFKCLVLLLFTKSSWNYLCFSAHTFTIHKQNPKVLIFCFKSLSIHRSSHISVIHNMIIMHTAFASN